ncbi:hypothetical protein HMPREF1553_00065 [Porphyromonas gingivalis F0568]|nr:hypothetical protein HMPREF1553_00065 [Porphyromonas gingivalis F0568]
MQIGKREVETTIISPKKRILISSTTQTENKAVSVFADCFFQYCGKKQ